MNLARRVRAIAIREVHHGRGRLAERRAERGTDDADDHVCLTARLQAAADDLSTGEISLNERFVDDDLRRRGRVAHRGEIMAVPERDAERLEVARSYNIVERLIRRGIGACPPFDGERAQ